MRKTILGREIPDQLDGIELKPFAGAFAARPSGRAQRPPSSADYRATASASRTLTPSLRRSA